MENRLGLKLAAMGLLSVVLLVGLLWIGSIVRTRQAQRDAVVHDIAESASYSQRLEGPVLVVPYEKTIREWKADGTAAGRHMEEQHVNGQLLILPETLKVDGQVPTELRKRGIYETRLYHANLRIHASFDVPEHYGAGDQSEDYHFDTPSVAIGISDIRGIQSASKVAINGATLRILPGTTAELLGSGLHAPLSSVDGSRAAHLEFDMELGIQGTSQLEVVPLGRDTRIILDSNWPNPSFNGQYLPVQHSVTASGFQAQWNTSFFSTNLEEIFHNCANASTCPDVNGRVLGVSFIDPVDQYLKTDRAIKYGFLFISLTFAGFFLFEVLKRLAVHPIQYSLVGAALALFYLLLLSLSEHIGFELAYAISSSACVALIGFYVSGILHSAKRGFGFAAMLAVLYGVLYGLLSAEDYALLMGSILLFGILAVVMVLTRGVDWGNLRDTGENAA